jgi:hypothetical protein
MVRWNRLWKVPGLAVLAVLAGTPDEGFAQTDHFRCYQAQEVFIEQPRPAVLIDELGGDSDVKIHNAAWLCAPASLANAEGTQTVVTEPAGYLTFYPLSGTGGLGRREITIHNQFGTQAIDLTVARMVAVPTRVEGGPEPHGISPFKCYVASGEPLEVPATITDWLQTGAVSLVNPKYFCSPADWTLGEMTMPAVAGEKSLACYTVTPGSQCPRRTIDFDNAIGAPDIFRMGPSTFACVPSTVLPD